MEQEKKLSSADKEMNFFDLCVVCWHALGQGCVAVWQLISRMIRLTYRYWWLVLTLMILAAAAALYLTRQSNTKYYVNAIAVLNGPSVQQLEQVFSPLRSYCTLPEEMPLKQLIREKKVSDFMTYRVIDCLRDSVADYVDFKQKSSPTDTVHKQMDDRVCLQFCIKQRNLSLIPEIEKEVLMWLNGSDALRREYEAFLPSMLEQVRFNHSQMEKLDSLTSEYYFNGHHGQQPVTGVSTGLVWVGDWKIHLFLDEIYSHQYRTEKLDRRLQLATAPVVLENHFTVDPKPVNGRYKYLFLFLLISWVGGCVLAEIIDKREVISAWLKR